MVDTDMVFLSLLVTELFRDVCSHIFFISEILALSCWSFFSF